MTAERNEAREVLAGAIARRNAIAAEIAKTKAEADEAWQNVLAHGEEVERLERELAERPALKRAEIRPALAEAKEKAGDLRAHREELLAKIKGLEDAAFMAGLGFDAKVGAVIQADPAASKLVDRYKKLKAEMATLGATLRHIGRAGGLGKDWDADPFWSEAADPRWGVAVKALQEDADAALPAV